MHVWYMYLGDHVTESCFTCTISHFQNEKYLNAHKYHSCIDKHAYGDYKKC